MKLNDSEKTALIPHAAFMLRTALKCRKEGILSVYDDICNTGCEFLKSVYQLIFGGHKPEDVEHLIKNMIDSSAGNNFEYVKYSVQSDVLISMECHPGYFVNLMIFSYFGLSFKKTYFDEMKRMLPDELFRTAFLEEYWGESGDKQTTLTHFKMIADKRKDFYDPDGYREFEMYGFDVETG